MLTIDGSENHPSIHDPTRKQLKCSIRYLVTPVAKAPDLAFYLLRRDSAAKKCMGRRKTPFRNAESKLGASLGARLDNFTFSS